MGHLVNMVRGQDQAAGVTGHLVNMVRGADQPAGVTGHLVNMVLVDPSLDRCVVIPLALGAVEVEDKAGTADLPLSPWSLPGARCAGGTSPSPAVQRFDYRASGADNPCPQAGLTRQLRARARTSLASTSARLRAQSSLLGRSVGPGRYRT